MRKKIYKYTAFILAVFILTTNICFSYPVKADTNWFNTYKDAVQSIVDNIKTDTNNSLDSMKDALSLIWRGVGYIVNPATLGSDMATIINYIKSHSLLGCDSNSSDQDCINAYMRALKQNITFNQDNFVINDSFNTVNKGLISAYTSSSGYTYVYTYNAQLSITSMPNGLQANAMKNLIQEKQDGFHLAYTSGNGNCYLLGYPERSVVWVKRNNEAYPYDSTTWQEITNVQPSGGFQYNMDSNGNLTTQSTYGIWREHFTTQNNSTFNMDSGGAAYPVSYGKTRIYKLYDDINIYKSENLGESKFYINSSVYKDYSTSSGDYTVTTDNSNHVTYGDITNYTNNYYNDNNEYPTPEQIEIYIEVKLPPETEPTPTPTQTPTPEGGTTVSSNGVNVYINNNPTAQNTNNNTYTDNKTINNTTNNHFDFSGLGTTSGNTVSGNEIQNGTNNIFEFISDVGKILGELIKNVGNFLKEILEGITEAITAILEDIPQIIAPLIEFVFGGLPAELKALVTLGITCVILIGVIKALKR